MEKQIMKIYQHKIKMILDALKTFFILGVIFGILAFIISNSIITTIIIEFALLILIFYYYFWNKSCFIVTNKSLSMNIRNGFFSKYDMKIHFSQIKDMAYSKNFRDADSSIVLKLGSKVIFPPVSFGEVKQKNTVSSSPGILVHNYLIKKLKNVGEDDATLLIGFNV